VAARLLGETEDLLARQGDLWAAGEIVGELFARRFQVGWVTWTAPTRNILLDRAADTRMMYFEPRVFHA
jgi:hypothetical protein